MEVGGRLAQSWSLCSHTQGGGLVSERGNYLHNSDDFLVYQVDESRTIR